MTRRNFAVIFNEKKSDDVCRYFERIEECDGKTKKDRRVCRCWRQRHTVNRGEKLHLVSHGIEMDNPISGWLLSLNVLVFTTQSRWLGCVGFQR